MTRVGVAIGFKALPAVSEWSDFDDRHVGGFAFAPRRLYVHLIVSESNNGQDSALTPAYRKPKRHNAKLCPLAIRERIVNALAAGDSLAAIARALQVSRNTVNAVAEQEWSKVEQRKARIAAQSERNATLAAERITDELESNKHIPLNVLVPVFGVNADKLLALRGDLTIQVSHQHQHIHAHINECSFKELLEHLPDDQANRIDNTPGDPTVREYIHDDADGNF